MIRKHIQTTMDLLKHVVTEPRDELNRWQAFVRYAYDLGVHGWKALNRDNAPQMAAALSFRTLFAILPVIVVSTLVVRAVGGNEKFEELVSGIIDALGLREWSVGGTPATPVDVASTATETAQSQNLGQLLEELAKAARSLELAALSWIGFALVIYAAIGLMVTIENSFNAVYGAPEGRSWARRVPMYWLVLTLGPVFIGITLYFDSQFGRWIETVNTWQWMLTVAKFVWGFTVAWVFMFAIYRLVPNTKVSSKAALVGGFVAAMFLTVGKGSLSAYFKSASLESLYGSLGSIPLFMFWVYLMWLVVLFGLEVSATIQMLAGRPVEELQEKRPQNGLVDPASVLNVMEIVTERFGAGQVTSTREIADQTLIPETLICQMIDRLVKNGFLHRVEGGVEDAVSLAQPPDRISGDRLIQVGFELVDEAGVGRQSALLTRLREVQRRLAGQATLASLLPEPAPPQADQAATS